MKFHIRQRAGWTTAFTVVLLFISSGSLTIDTRNRNLFVVQNPMSFELRKDMEATRLSLMKVRRSFAALRTKGRYIVINTHANMLSIRTADGTIRSARCSTGSGGTLVNEATGKKWVFETPQGVFKVTSMIVNPWWRRPDWAYIEENQDLPKNENERYDPRMLGDYAIGFGNGYFIHGTLYEMLLGISVTHGCVRLGEEDLKYVFDLVSIGTPIYIF